MRTFGRERAYCCLVTNARLRLRAGLWTRRSSTALGVLLLDASSSGRPALTPASAGLLDAKSEDQAVDGVGRVGDGISASERLAVVHVSGSREIDRAAIDGAEATRRLTLARIDVDLHDGRRERFDADRAARRSQGRSRRAGLRAP
jgi:hypothetical protein